LGDESNEPFRLELLMRPRSQASRPGLTESALQAEVSANSKRASEGFHRISGARVLHFEVVFFPSTNGAKSQSPGSRSAPWESMARSPRKRQWRCIISIRAQFLWLTGFPCAVGRGRIDLRHGVRSLHWHSSWPPAARANGQLFLSSGCQNGCVECTKGKRSRQRLSLSNRK